MAKDLRSFIEAAKSKGMAYEINKEVDPKTNVGALAGSADRALIFNNIKGYSDWTMVSGLVQNREMEQVIFNVDSKADVVKAMAQAMDQGPSPHTVIENAPCQEIVWEGDDADLTRLPAVQHSELDGGAYLGSAIGIVVDPETGLHNTTWPRVQIGDGKNCPFMIFSPHVSQIAGKYARMGKPMQMALAIGVHPAIEIAASLSMHHPNCGELDYASAILGEQMEFAKCGSIDVDVPAHAEIIVEGEMIPNHVQSEGPFGNYLGTYSTGPISRDGIQKAPVLSVKRITMRKKPVFRHLQSTVWTEHQRLCMLPLEGAMFNALKEMGLNVHDVYMPSWGGCSLTIIQMTPRAEGEVQDALLKAAMWENTTISFMSHVCVAVNRDVNIYDARDVLWAMSTRTNWAEDTQIVKGTRSSPLMPVSHKVPGVPWRRAGKSMIDATVLPPREDADWWDQNRAWPMGTGKVCLSDFVDGYHPSMSMSRITTHDEDLARKPGDRKPQVPV